MLRDFDLFWLYWAVRAQPYVWLYLVVQQMAFGAYLWFMREDNPWLGAVPVVNLFKKHKMGGAGMFLTVMTCLFTVTALLSAHWTQLLVALILNSIVNYKFGAMYFTAASPIIYAFVPFGKFFCYYKEVSACKK